MISLADTLDMLDQDGRVAVMLVNGRVLAFSDLASHVVRTVAHGGSEERDVIEAVLVHLGQPPPGVEVDEVVRSAIEDLRQAEVLVTS